MSPSAPRRTIRILTSFAVSCRPSAVGRVGHIESTRADRPSSPGQSGQEIARGMAFFVADDRRSAAVRLARPRVPGPTRPCSRCPCSGRPASAAAAAARRSDRRRRPRSRRHARPRRARPDRRPAGSAARSLQGRHRSIVVHRDDQPIGFGRRALQVAHVADVQQIEAAVGERDPASRGAIARHRLDELGLRKNLSHPALRPLLEIAGDRGAQLARRDGRGAALHHDQAAGVVGQPRRFVE